MPFDYSKPDLPIRLSFHLAKAILETQIGNRLLCALASFSHQDEEWLDTTHLELVLPSLGLEFHGYNLVQISDFHIGTWASRSHLEYAIDQVNQLQPDLVAITGDFVTNNPEAHGSDLIDILNKISSKDGVVAVLGNHDHWANAKLVRQILQKTGVIELRNSNITISRGKDLLHLAGVDDVMEGLEDLDQVIKRLPSNGTAILLVHEPDFAGKSAICARFDLQLSGHTHGGQVHIPRIGPLILPKMGKKYPAGLYKIKEMYLYTNRGLGTADLQIRYNCKAEITHITLRSGLITNWPQTDSF